MSAATEAIIDVLGVTLRAWLATPEGQRLLAQAKDALIAEAPGVGGAFLRALAAAVPHDVESIGFRKDGPG